MGTLPWYNRCATSMLDSVGFYNEADIEMKRGKFLPFHKHWSYDMTYTQHATDSDYFYDRILHELGHAHGLNHIRDPRSLMYWYEPLGQRDSITSGTTGPHAYDGALDMVRTDTTYYPPCYGDSILITSKVHYCEDPDLSVPAVSTNPYNLNLFPNPINYGNITVDYDLPASSSVQFEITDCTGRVLILLSRQQEAEGEYEKQVNVTNFAGGVYFFIATINEEVKTIKFIKI